MNRYEEKFKQPAFDDDGKPTLHFAEIICQELRDRELDVVSNATWMQHIEHQTNLFSIRQQLKEVIKIADRSLEDLGRITKKNL